MNDYDRRSSKIRVASARVATPDSHPWTKVANHLGAEAPWWHSVKFPTVGSCLYTDPSRLIGHGLLKQAIEGGPQVRSANWEGNMVVPPKQLLQACVDALHLRPVWVEGGTKRGSHLFANTDTMVQLYFYSQGRCASVSAVTTNQEMTRRVGQLFDRCLKAEDPERGQVYTLARTMAGYRISHLGLAGSPIERGNYSPKVLKAYDHVVEDLNCEDPCGRLVVLAGEPGTGKTYLVRSLLGAAPKAAFVLIPPHLVEELGSPEILPSLTAAKGEMDGPIVLVIEDADACLVPRKDTGNKQSNMNAISSLLNLGDGILGSVLDIRIIATTNAEELELDPATKRPGRMCTYAAVDALPPQTAVQALYRLTGKKVAFEKQATIAEIYFKARNMGWKPPSSKKKAANEQDCYRREIL